MRKLMIILFFVILTAFWTACNQPAAPAGTPAPATTNTAANADEGKKLYGQYCGMCHGADGNPGQPNNMNLPNFADAATQDKWTDDHLKDVMTKGQGRMMAVAGIKPEEVDTLVKYLRTLKK